MKEREAYGVKFVVSEETFNEYKGTLQDQLEEAYKEIDRLQNIIDELEKSIKDEYDYCDKRKDPAFGVGMGVSTRILNKLKELKEGNKDEYK